MELEPILISSMHVVLKCVSFNAIYESVYYNYERGDGGKVDETLSQGVVHTAKNPFVLAFRKNEEIAAFLTRGRKKQRNQ
ncbi:hypothetical protein Bca52824_092633 [Brassica carinata]|uniref:Uncharacterized protein n=1 Tax=Brassica carinata TaxID=52824 RepID=A0A8X7NTK8_BRACI|nr:hypothetical protein Bca52824_092633 [Brassica carinata]